MNNVIWWNGFEFLYQLEIEWLVNELIYFGDEEVFKEVVRNVVNIIYFLVNSIVNELIILRVDNLIDIV